MSPPEKIVIDNDIDKIVRLASVEDSRFGKIDDAKQSLEGRYLSLHRSFELYKFGSGLIIILLVDCLIMPSLDKKTFIFVTFLEFVGISIYAYYLKVDGFYELFQSLVDKGVKLVCKLFGRG